MRKEYRKAVREEFTRGLARALPRFEPVKVKAQVLWQGEAVFRWVPCSGLHCFVILSAHHSGRQSFTVEVAWSSQGRFPDVTSRPTMILAPGDPDPTDVDEGIVRLGDLAHRRDAWWDLPDPALERPGDIRALQASVEPIEPAVAMQHARGPTAAALKMLADSGVSFLEKLVALRCGSV